MAVCPLPMGITAEAVPAGFQAVTWAPVGVVHHPPGWRAQIGPNSASVLRISSPDGVSEVVFEASCCRGSDLLRSEDAEVARWSGRTVWIDERPEEIRTTQRYFTFPFAQVDAEQLREKPGRLFRPPIALSAAAHCRTRQDCAHVRQIVRSIRYDPQSTRLAQQGDERVARIGAVAGRVAAAAVEPAESAGGPSPPPEPPAPQPTFTSELCGH